MKIISKIFQIGSRENGGTSVSPGGVLLKLSDFMRKDLSAIALGLVLSGVVVTSSIAADPATVTLRGHVPPAVANGRAHLLGHMAGDTSIQFSIGLPLRNRDELERLIRQVSDPANPNYGHYLTPQQFTERFGPTVQDYEAIEAFARKNSFTITTEHPNRVLLSLSGRAADVEKAFNVTLNRYQHPTESREFFAPDREPTIDSSLHVLHIEGLDNFYIPHPNLNLSHAQIVKPGAVRPAAIARANVTPALGTGPGGTYQGSDFRNAYIPGSSLTGTGQNVDLLQFDGFFTNDIATYAAAIGLTNGPTIVVVPIDGGVSAPAFPGDVEVSLDIEMVLSMSPGVDTIFVYEEPNNGSPWADMLNRMANDNNARQISSSWGNFGGPDPVSEQIFQQMDVQGQSFFQASGDSDAYLPGELIPFPSDSPYITVVGGTTLTTANPTPTNLVYTSETVWNADPINGGGSSGGISTVYSIPFWQTNINFTLSGGSSTLRNLPDVALTGDNVFVIADGGFQFVGVAGTSCAAPLWNGFTSLINEQAAATGHQSVGFLNPALYALAANAAVYANAFHDVTNGNNTWNQSPNAFFAVSNYDLCTGLGTPNGINLINDLLSGVSFPAHISPPPPPYGTNMASVTGGNPNGTWSLFIQDDTPLNSGYVSNGWVLSLTLADIVGTSADLEMYMSTPSSAVFTGQPVTFFLAVTNYGPSTSTNVQVIDSLTTTVSVVATNATQGTVSRSGSTLIWNVGTLAMNAGAGLTLTVQPHGLGTFANTANCQAGTPDPNPDDDLVSTNVSVVAPSVTLVPSFIAGSQTFQINVPGPTNPSLTVVIQASTNLVSTNWVNVHTGVPPFIFTDPAGSNHNRFYRALLLP